MKTCVTKCREVRKANVHTCSMHMYVKHGIFTFMQLSILHSLKEKKSINEYKKKCFCFLLNYAFLYIYWLNSIFCIVTYYILSFLSKLALDEAAFLLLFLKENTTFSQMFTSWSSKNEIEILLRWYLEISMDENLSCLKYNHRLVWPF